MNREYLAKNGLTLKLGEDGITLQADYKPRRENPILKLEHLKSAISDTEFGQLMILDDALDQLVRRVAVSPLGFTVKIGEVRDAQLRLEVSPDRMKAELTITKSYGGRNITYEDVQRALTSENILYGIQFDQIEAAVAAGEASKVAVAIGTSPENGKDTQFLSLIPEMKERPKFKDNEVADYRNLGNVISVCLGDPLMRRTHPTPGIPGRNILGEELPARDGLDIPLATDLTGIACDLRDADLLIAAISGCPVVRPNGVIVEPVLKVNNVDLSTGNLHFKGSLEITGDVRQGMEVTATENITIGGMVEAARISAGGDIEIKGGIVGPKQSRTDLENNAGASVLEAGGSVVAQFAENAIVTAGKDIHLKQLSMLSDLSAGGSVTIGEPGGRKGHLVGGTCRAAAVVHLIVAGSRASVPTVIEVGVDPVLSRKIETTVKDLAEKVRLRDDVDKVLLYAKEKPNAVTPGIVAIKQRQLEKYKAEITELINKKKRLERKLEVCKDARVEIEKEILVGVSIKIAGQSLQIERDMDGQTFHLENEAVIGIA